VNETQIQIGNFNGKIILKPHDRSDIEIIIENGNLGDLAVYTGDDDSLIIEVLPKKIEVAEISGFKRFLGLFLKAVLEVEEQTEYREVELFVQRNKYESVSIHGYADVHIDAISNVLTIEHVGNSELEIENINHLTIESDSQGDIEIENAEHLYLDIRGSSEVSIRSDNMTFLGIQATGNGDFEIKSPMIEHCKIEVEDSSCVEIRSETVRTLEIESNGSGDFDVNISMVATLIIKNNDTSSFDIEIDHLGVLKIDSEGSEDFNFSTETVDHCEIRTLDASNFTVVSESINTVTLYSEGCGDVEITTKERIESLIVETYENAEIEISASVIGVLDCELHGVGDLSLKARLQITRKLEQTDMGRMKVGA
jgi:hypothetical protein